MGRLAPVTDPPAFTGIERKIARFVARGMGNYRIACDLGLSQSMVRFRINRLYEKFELNRDDRNSRVRLALLYLNTEVYE